MKQFLELIARLIGKGKSTIATSTKSKVSKKKANYDHVLVVKDDYTTMQSGGICTYMISSLTGHTYTKTCQINNSTRFVLRWLNEEGGMDKIIQYCNETGSDPSAMITYMIDVGCRYHTDILNLDPNRSHNSLILSYLAWYTKQSKGAKLKIEKWPNDNMVIIMKNIYGDHHIELITSGNLITQQLKDRINLVNELFKDKIIDDISINGEQRGYCGLDKIAEYILTSLYAKEFDIVGSNIVLNSDNNIQLVLSEEKKDD